MAASASHFSLTAFQSAFNIYIAHLGITSNVFTFRKLLLWERIENAAQNEYIIVISDTMSIVM